MPQGTIKRLAELGVGRITPDDGGPDLAFHATAVVGTRFEKLHQGQRVEYDCRVDPVDRQRVRALKVRPIEE